MVRLISFRELALLYLAKSDYAAVELRDGGGDAGNDDAELLRRAQAFKSSYVDSQRLTESCEPLAAAWTKWKLL